jgi:hypothetical protein
MQMRGKSKLAAWMAFMGFMALVPRVAAAASACGSSGSHTICLSAAGTLTGQALVTVTNSPNNGTVVFRWAPDGGSVIDLMTDFAPSQLTNDYSFVWPTDKYPNGSGSLQAQAEGSGSKVSIRVSLSNGGFAATPRDWQSYLPSATWTGTADPVVAAVGDGASGETKSASVVAGLQAAHPNLFLYLGDVYETGTYTENLNHYGAPNLGGAGNQWGQLWSITQPTLGNHEAPSTPAYVDYWHQRPLWMSFTFGNVLFLDLDSSASMKSGSDQYQFVQSVLSASSRPPCVVAFWHILPVGKDGAINNGQTAMWALLVNNGGDLVLNGHRHTMIQFKRLNAALQPAGASERAMVDLVSGAGGHSVGGTATNDSRIEWSVGKTPGAVYLTLNGAARSGTPAGLSWTWKSASGSALHSGSLTC